MGELALDGRAPAGGVVSMTPLQQNAGDLEQELSWFSRVLDTRFKLYFGQGVAVQSVFEVTPPDLSRSTSPMPVSCTIISRFPERIAIMLAWCPISGRNAGYFFYKKQDFRPQVYRVWRRRGRSRWRFYAHRRDAGLSPGRRRPGDPLCRADALRRQHFFAKHNILRLPPRRRAADESAAAAFGRVSEPFHDRPARRPDSARVPRP